MKEISWKLSPKETKPKAKSIKSRRSTIFKILHFQSTNKQTNINHERKRKKKDSFDEIFFQELITEYKIRENWERERKDEGVMATKENEFMYQVFDFWGISKKYLDKRKNYSLYS